jgi:hypothetical protein
MYDDKVATTFDKMREVGDDFILGPHFIIECEGNAL